VLLFSCLGSAPPCLVGLLWPFSTPCRRVVPGSTVVLSSGFFQARSVDLCSSTAPTRPTRVFPIVPATRRCLHHPVPATTRRHMVCTRLRVNLTCPRVDLMLLRVYLTCRRVRLELVPVALPPTSVRSVLHRCSVGFFSAFFFISFVLLFFCICIFICILWAVISLPCCGLILRRRLLLVVVPASLWFFVVPALQLSFHCDGCFTRIGLFTEFLCILHRLVRPWNRPGLLMILFESLVNTIACCSILWTGSSICSYICTTHYHLGLLLGSPPHVCFQDLSLFLPFGSEVGKILPCSPFLICLKKKKKEKEKKKQVTCLYWHSYQTRPKNLYKR
jgi:hypothetical protein